MQQQQDDMVVIQKILQGDHNAYAILVDKYRAYVFTLALRYVSDRNIAEELAQDVFVKAYRCLADFKGGSKFSTWLYTIVNTTCLSHLRKRKDKTVLVEQEQLLFLSGHTANEEGAEGKAEEKYRRQVLVKAIGSLPHEDAQIITMFYQAEQSVEEIGRILGMTAGNVKVKLHRARKKLREITDLKNIMT